MEKVVHIYRTKFGLLLSGEIQQLGRIIRTEGSWFNRLTSGKFDPMETGNIDVFIAEMDDRKVGWCTASKAVIGFAPDISKPVECIEFNICVSSHYRKMGVATKLLETAKEELGDAKPFISFPKDEKGLRTYKKSGIPIFNDKEDKLYYSIE